MKWCAIALIVLTACSQPKAQEPEKWQTMTAPKCVALCAPLDVARFTPQCMRRARDSYYRCPGDDLVGIEEVCVCGKVIVQKAQSVPRVDTVTPLILHHGLKQVLK